MPSKPNSNGAGKHPWPLVNAITVEGFKSIADRQRMEIRPLTILAGANSSGKSSMMQPALLIKQTLESSYDPGPLRIDGPNVKMTEFDQLFWGTGTTIATERFAVGFEGANAWSVRVTFRLGTKGLHVTQTDSAVGGVAERLRRSMTPGELSALQKPPGERVKVVRERCFLRPQLYVRDVGSIRMPSRAIRMASEFAQRLIHVPGLRFGSAERQFPQTPIGEFFVGTFEEYSASVLHRWQVQKSKKLEQVGEDLETIGLTSRVDVQEISDIALTIRVGRLPHPTARGRNDMVSIADVGFGVSQVLPGIVALRVAKPDDTVYIEQPEFHLHPNAQVRLAELLANAANRGVRVIAETHSSLLIRGVQTLVAEGKLKPELVKLHWFQRDKRGATTISSADLDSRGAFGDWPEDFDQVELESDTQYLQAAGYRIRKR